MIKTNGKIVVLFLFLTMLFTMISNIFLLPSFIQASNGLPIPDISFSFSDKSPFELAKLYGKEAIKAYRGIQILDIFYPIVYSLFFSFTIVFFQQKTNNGKHVKFLAYIPFIGAFFDYIENLSIYLCFESFPDANKFSELFGRPTSGLKWIFFFISILIITIQLMIFLYQRYFKQNSK